MDQRIITFPMPTAGKISLVVAPRAVLDRLTSMLATLALRGRVLVVDGGNCFEQAANASRRFRVADERLQRSDATAVWLPLAKRVDGTRDCGQLHRIADRGAGAMALHEIELMG